MKKLILSTLLFSFAAGIAHANETTVKTLITCEQEDGDQWYSVGVVPSLAPSKINLVVVFNDEDYSSKNRVLDRSATLTRSGNHIKIVSDDGTAKLVVNVARSSKSGYLTLIADGPGAKTLPVTCYENSEISYDSQIGLE